MVKVVQRLSSTFILTSLFITQHTWEGYTLSHPFAVDRKYGQIMRIRTESYILSHRILHSLSRKLSFFLSFPLCMSLINFVATFTRQVSTGDKRRCSLVYYYEEPLLRNSLILFLARLVWLVIKILSTSARNLGSYWWHLSWRSTRGNNKRSKDCWRVYIAFLFMRAAIKLSSFIWLR